MHRETQSQTEAQAQTVRQRNSRRQRYRHRQTETGTDRDTEAEITEAEAQTQTDRDAYKGVILPLITLLFPSGLLVIIDIFLTQIRTFLQWYNIIPFRSHG